MIDFAYQGKAIGQLRQGTGIVNAEFMLLEPLLHFFVDPGDILAQNAYADQLNAAHALTELIDVRKELRTANKRRRKKRKHKLRSTKTYKK